MNVWSCLNTLILVFGIGFWMYVVSNNIIHAMKEEYRKTSEHEFKLLDKWLDKISNNLVDVFKKIKTIEDGKQDSKTEISEKTDNISWMK